MVKTFIKLLYLICTVLIFDTLSAQTSGIVTYQKIIDYGIEPVGKPRWDNYIKNLPKEGKFTYQLRFQDSESVFEGVPSEDSPLDPTVVRALNALPLLAPPKVKIEKIYQNIEHGKRVTEVEFMTRYFLVEEDLNQPKWRLTSGKKKVLDFICTGAQLDTKDGIITAWFTSQIPVQFGPDYYFGLPGLILAIEIDGKMNVLASNIDLKIENKIVIPDNGQKISKSEFEKTVGEKNLEWKKNGTSSTKKQTRGK